MIEFLATFGIWNWIIAGLILLLLELIAPGIFLIWIGLAALITGIFTVLTSSYVDFDWKLQLVLFLILSVALVLIGRRYFNWRGQQTDEPLLNRRGDQLVGLRSTLEEPIINGFGRARFNDTLWRITGPDLPAGSVVCVIDFNNGLLLVVKAD